MKGAEVARKVENIEFISPAVHIFIHFEINLYIEWDLKW